MIPGDPRGFCQCGCGEKTAIAKQSNSQYGHVNGQPVSFVQGHSGRMRPRRDPVERFWAQVDKSGDCWLWLGHRMAEVGGNGGYGQFTLTGGTTVIAHRYSYTISVGPIPEGLVIDHLCRNRACVNPAHLEPVTNLENMARGLRPPNRSVCGHGHAMTPENTYTLGKRRACRTCRREADCRHEQRRAEARRRLRGAA